MTFRLLFTLILVGYLAQTFSSSALAGESGNAFEVALKTETGQSGVSRSLWLPFSEKQFTEEIIEKLPTDSTEPFIIFSLDSLKSSAEKFKAQLNKENINSEVVLISDEIYEELEQKAATSSHGALQALRPGRMPAEDESKLGLKDLYSRPSTKDVILGSTVTAFKGIIATQWFAMGLNPWVAASLAVTQTFLTFQNNVWYRTHDIFFKTPLNLGSGEVSRGNEMFRRKIYVTLTTELLRAISGPVGHAHSVMSWQGQGEVLSHVAALGVGGAIFHTVRNRLFNSEETKFANKWLMFDIWFPTAIFSFLDLAGIHIKTLFKVGFIDVNVSTVAILLTFIGASMVVKAKPEAALRLASAQEGILNSLIKKFNKLVNPETCSNLMDLR